MSRPLLRTGVLALCVVALSTLVFQTLQPHKQPLAAPQTAMIHAPQFPENADWLNTDKPLSLRGLKGKIVLLDFWTYCCINCIQIMPDLKKLERKYPNELVVIGVHSAKFENEGETQNIRNAILRYKIEHPVLNDKDMRVWDEYAVTGWPTLTLINPNGRIVRQQSGEGQYEELDETIGELVREFKARGELNTTPLKFALEAAQVEKTPLRFPGKVLASGNQLFVADSNHNRVVVSDLAGNVQTVFGSGAQGFDDGDAAKATFHNPQGMALSEDGDTLYIADTDNHAIRALDLKTKQVSTIAGTGKQAPWRSKGGVGTRAALASPWDVLRVGNTLYLAMAGTHQIWAMDLTSGAVAPYAGSGAEARYDASLMESALAQPSGLATDGKKIFFADSESSSIRTVALPGNGNDVGTLVGGDPNPRNLFAFGDKDGQGFGAKLQHPLGVAYDGGNVYVADTYNHKIKVLRAQTGRIETLDLKAKFSEPAGVSVAGGKLFVADTNSHKIRVVDLETNTVTDLQFKNLPTPLPAEPVKTVVVAATGKALAAQTLAANASGELVLDVKLPAGYKLNKDAPQKFDAKIEGSGLTLAKANIRKPEFALPLRVKFTSGQAGQSGTLAVDVTVNYCSDDSSLCKVKMFTMEVLFRVESGGRRDLKLNATISDEGKVKTSSGDTLTANSGEIKMEKIVKSEEEWQQELTPEQYKILRKKGTEPAFTGALLDNHKDGVYKCAACGEQLFDSKTKFESGSGWPSFYQPISQENIEEESDNSYGMRRVEVLCARCEGHLGHVFEDGPNPTGLRYCINSASLQFEEK